MNYIDIVIAVILVAFGIGGLRKGIIIEAATLIGLFFGLYGAFHFSDFTANKLVQWMEIDPKYLHIIAFIVTFIVLVLVVNLLGKLLSKLIKTLNLGFIDKIGGFIFGIAKGLLMCSLLIMLLNIFKLTGVVKEETKQESLLYPFVEQTVPYVYQGYDLVREAIRDEDEQCPPETSDEDPQATEILQDTVRLL